MSAFVANELSAFCFGVESRIFVVDLGAIPGRLRRTLRTGLHLLVADQYPVGVVAGQFSWAVEDDHRVVEIAMDPDVGLKVVAPMPIGRDLEFFPFKGDAVVAPDDPLVLFAEDVVEVWDDGLDESRPLFQRRLHEFVVVGGQVGLSEVPVGLLYVGDAVKSQFLGEPVLVGSEGPLDASPGLRGVSITVTLHFRFLESTP